MSYRVFTVEEANRLVPVLEDAFRRIEAAREHARGHHEKLQVLDALWGDAVKEPDNPDHDEFREHRDGLSEAGEIVEETVKEEVLERGLRFPSGGLQHGLVDFPTGFEGRWVYLCWERGEPELRFWHEVDGGYRGRRPITPEQAETMGRDVDRDALDDTRLDF